MKIHFEVLAEPKRAGGIEVATRELVAHLQAACLRIKRSSDRKPVRMPDCVHLHGIWSPKMALSFLAWRTRGVPCLISPHGMLDPWALAHKRFKKRVAWHVYQKLVLDRAALLHGTSENETSQFNQLGLTAPMALIPWGVSLPQVPGERSAYSSVRTALFVGRIYPVKGLPLLVQAWARMRPAGWKVMIVGPDEAGHQAEVMELVRKFKLDADFEFTGPLEGDALRAAYECASLFILPSYTENFGMVVAEAMAHALPVVTTTGTPWSILRERGCGWWVAPAVEHLAQALSTATALDDATLRGMGAKGRELVASEFSWRRSANRMKQVYQWIAGAETKPEFVWSA